MSLEFNHTILYSKHKEVLSTYLSELLEASIDKKEEGIEIKTNDLSLVICDEPNNESHLQHNFNTAFHFTVASKKELEEMLQKVQFIWFRSGKNQKPPLIMEKETPEGIHSFFTVEDIDGRQWIFSTFGCIDS